MLNFVVIILSVVAVAVVALAPLFILLFLGEYALNAMPFGRAGRFLLVAFKSLRRNLLRTALTYLASFVLVVVIVMVWSVLYFLDQLTTAKQTNLKVIITEKYQMGGLMPFPYAGPLSEGAARPGHSEDARPEDSMTWQVYLGTLGANKLAREDQIFFIGMEPRKILTIMDSVFNELRPSANSGQQLAQMADLQRAVKEMESNKRAIIMGAERLAATNKRVGERLKVTGINYTGIDLECEIVGAFPPGKYDMFAVMNRDYLNDAIDAYPKTHGGVRHPLAVRNLNNVWLQVPDLSYFSRIAEQIDNSGRFVDPAVKCETLSSGIDAFIEGFKDLLWAMRWLLAPAILGTMVLIIANAISISVRERRSEMAILKVLGFRPVQIMTLVLGEALLIGGISGTLSTVVTYLVVNHLPHPATFQIWVPDNALWWGPLIGAATALAGSFFPAWSACKVRVSEVFARTA